MKCRFRIVCAILVFQFLIIGCQKQQDPRIEKLQKDMDRIAAENKSLHDELRQVQQQISDQKKEVTIVPQTQSKTLQSEEMTVEVMKAELRPLLNDFIKKIKAVTDTPRRGSQYGMRIEYDLPAAVWGLVQNNDPDIPYTAKVIVPYEKFVESESDSKSYGRGTTQFIFGYHNHQWVLQNYE